MTNNLSFLSQISDIISCRLSKMSVYEISKRSITLQPFITENQLFILKFIKIRIYTNIFSTRFVYIMTASQNC